VFDAYLGTTDGLQRLRDGALEPLGLAGERIMAVHAAADGTVLAGSYGNGLFRSTDAGATWSRAEAGLTADAFRWLGPDPQRPGALLAGTEPARIFRSSDGGASWRELDGIAALPRSDEWFLPYSRRAGAVRNIHAAGRLFASVEVGERRRRGDVGVRAGDRRRGHPSRHRRRPRAVRVARHAHGLAPVMAAGVAARRRPQVIDSATTSRIAHGLAPKSVVNVAPAPLPVGTPSEMPMPISR
jgi:hypothetical protein